MVEYSRLNRGYTNPVSVYISSKLLNCLVSFYGMQYPFIKLGTLSLWYFDLVAWLIPVLIYQLFCLKSILALWLWWRSVWCYVCKFTTEHRNQVTEINWNVLCEKQFLLLPSIFTYSLKQVPCEQFLSRLNNFVHDRLSSSWMWILSFKLLSLFGL